MAYYDDRPRRPGGRPGNFGGRDDRPAQRGEGKPRDFKSAPPRYAKPTGRPVPPAVRDDAPGAQGRPAGYRGKPRFEDRPPRFEGKAPRYADKPPRYADKSPRYADKPPRFEDRPPRFEDRPPRFEGKAPRFADKPPINRPALPPRPETPPRYDAPETPENLLIGRNPIREALKARQPLEKMLVSNGELTGSAREIVAMARDAGVVVQFVDRARLDALAQNHQGMAAYASAAEYGTVEGILEKAAQKGEDAFVVVLDGITDPHNLGAIIRSAECMGAHGVIVPERRSAGLNPAAVKAAAGALAYLSVARVTNLSQTLDLFKEKGLWILGADADGTPAGETDLTGAVALVIGAEGEGLSPLVKRHCDKLVGLPMYGHIGSLNASVAAGMLLGEIAKARHHA